MNEDDAARTQVVDDAFRGLDTWVAPSVAAPPAAAIVARGRRRRTAHVTLAGVAVLAVLAGGYVAMGGRPAGPVTAPAPTSPVKATVTGDRAQATKIPDGFLPHEREMTDVVDDFGYGPECFGEPVMRRSGRQAVGTAEVGVTQSLFVYVDESTAKSVMSNVRNKLATCSGFGGATVLEPAASPAWGDEAATITLAKPADGAGEQTGAPVRYDVVRVGRAIAEVTGYPEVPQIDQDAQAIAGRLCYYDADCAPRAGLPAALPELTNGGEAWVAVVGVIKVTDRPQLPGETIAAAAEVGYHATVVPTTCDDGADGALGLTGLGNYYTAVYFASQADAEKFAAALPALPAKVKVLQVHTNCL
ncbi:MAG TPA: hypothetical protein VK659_18515 [Asanoa sp.]|nr:hypothetical protein [Asanoa sp.]